MSERTSPVTLRFGSPHREVLYLADRQARIWPQTRVAIVLTIGIFIGFAPLDPSYAPGHLPEMRSLRWIATLLFSGLLLLTLPSWRPSQPVMAAIGIVVAYGLILLMMLSCPDCSYQFHDAILLGQIGTWIIIGLRFTSAACINAVAFALFVAADAKTGFQSGPLTVQHYVYLASGTMLAGFAGYFLERRDREAFLAREELAALLGESRAEAARDGLTGLLNRRAMNDNLEALAAAASRGQSIGAVLLIDLDRFKPVNDLHGHRAGDDLLVAVSRRLLSTVRPSDLVGRIGGDEFLVVVNGLPSPEFAGEMRDRLRAAIEAPCRVRDGASLEVQCQVGASIGISCFPMDSVSAVELLRLADEHMYREKAARHGRAPGPLAPPCGPDMDATFP